MINFLLYDSLKCPSWHVGGNIQMIGLIWALVFTNGVDLDNTYPLYILIYKRITKFLIKYGVLLELLHIIHLSLKIAFKF